MCFNIVLGLKVFMDAHKPFTLEEGDRYPLGPPYTLVAQRKSNVLIRRRSTFRNCPRVPNKQSPFDGIGIRAMLRTWILRVRIPWGAPVDTYINVCYNFIFGGLVIMGAQGLCKPLVGVRSSHPPPFKEKVFSPVSSSGKTSVL